MFGARPEYKKGAEKEALGAGKTEETNHSKGGVEVSKMRRAKGEERRKGREEVSAMQEGNGRRGIRGGRTSLKMEEKM